MVAVSAFFSACPNWNEQEGQCDKQEKEPIYHAIGGFVEVMEQYFPEPMTDEGFIMADTLLSCGSS